MSQVLGRKGLRRNGERARDPQAFLPLYPCGSRHSHCFPLAESLPSSKANQSTAQRGPSARDTPKMGRSQGKEVQQPVELM